MRVLAPNMPPRSFRVIWSPESDNDLRAIWRWGAEQFSPDLADKHLRDIRRAAITLTTSPLKWSPVPGESILVMTGLAGDDAFLVAFYELPDDRYRIGSTMILHKDRGPVVLGFNGYDGRRIKDKSNATLDWATCWKCPGESGAITYREDGRVTISEE